MNNIAVTCISTKTQVMDLSGLWHWQLELHWCKYLKIIWLSNLHATVSIKCSQEFFLNRVESCWLSLPWEKSSYFEIIASVWLVIPVLNVSNAQLVNLVYSLLPWWSCFWKWNVITCISLSPNWKSKRWLDFFLVQILANPYVLWVGVATDQACFNTSHEHSNRLGSEKF